MNDYVKIKKALQIARKAHENQKDKGDDEYIFHPVTVALMSETVDEKIVGLLHDVLEDSDVITEEEIEEDFGEEVKEALKELNRDKSVDYFTYIENIKSPIALKVKLNDLTMNSDLSRIKDIKQKDLERIEKYEKAKEIINDKLKKANHC